MNQARFLKTVGAGLAVMAMAAAAEAANVTYTTAQSEFDAGVLNQGWWSDVGADLEMSHRADNPVNHLEGSHI